MYAKGKKMYRVGVSVSSTDYGIIGTYPTARGAMRKGIKYARDVDVLYDYSCRIRVREIGEDGQPTGYEIERRTYGRGLK